MLGVVEAIDLESSFREKVRVSSLPTRHVKDSRALRKSENVDYAGSLVSIPLEREDRLILEQIPGVEV